MVEIGAQTMYPSFMTTWSDYLDRTANSKPRATLAFALTRFPSTKLPFSAVDLGFGAGNDTLALLKHGWEVLAIDNNRDAITRLSNEVFDPYRSRLTAICSSFEAAAWRKVDLVNASYALPFCDPQQFAGVWAKITGSIHAGGRFAGSFFGPGDGWAHRHDMTILSKRNLASMFEGWKIEHFREMVEKKPTASGALKQWHKFEVVAQVPIAK